MESLCFDCANGYAHKCNKILRGTPIEGWTAEEVKGGGYCVKACPNFVCDKKRNTTVKEIVKALHINERTFYRLPIKERKKLASKKGYTLIVTKNNKTRKYNLLKN